MTSTKPSSKFRHVQGDVFSNCSPHCSHVLVQMIQIWAQTMSSVLPRITNNQLGDMFNPVKTLPITTKGNALR